MLQKVLDEDYTDQKKLLLNFQKIKSNKQGVSFLDVCMKNNVADIISNTATHEDLK